MICLNTKLAFQDTPKEVNFSLGAGMPSVEILLDLAKAFDSLDRVILFRELDSCGVKQSSLQRFMIFFSNRLQHLSCNICYSPKLPGNFETPQGRITGPILFKVYKKLLIRSTGGTKNFFSLAYVKKRSLLVLTVRCVIEKLPQ